jgi:phage tail-like protein
MPNRTAPYHAYNFVLYLKDANSAEKPLGGFSHVDGLDPDGLDPKIPGIHKVSDVTLKRGVIDSSDLSSWITSARGNGASAMREVTVTQLDVGNLPLKSWRLVNVTPVKYTGPELGSKGGDLAIEELVLSPERIEIAPPR